MLGMRAASRAIPRLWHPQRYASVATDALSARCSRFEGAWKFKRKDLRLFTSHASSSWNASFYHRTGIVSPLLSSGWHHTQQQFRTYVFPPTSWAEWKLRLQRGLSKPRKVLVEIRNRCRRRHRRIPRFKQVPVTLHEYANLDKWFDSAHHNRPVTSYEPDGLRTRFVNPWQSESSNGLHSFADLVHWRWLRIQMYWNRTYGRYLHWKAKRKLRAMERLAEKALEIPQEETLVASSTTLPPAAVSPRAAAWRLPSALRSASDKATQSVSGPDARLSNSSDRACRPPLTRGQALQLTWIGHATCVVRCGNVMVLTDPIFARGRIGPFSAWSTPIDVRRYVDPPHSIVDLFNTTGESPLAVCVLSHDHYDHLHWPSIQELRPYVGLWVVPLGIADWLVQNCDIPRHRIMELRWWESVQVMTLAQDEKTPTGLCSSGEQKSMGNDQDGIPAPRWYVTCHQYGVSQKMVETTIATPTSTSSLQQRSYFPLQSREGANEHSIEHGASSTYTLSTRQPDQLAPTKFNEIANHATRMHASERLWITCCPTQHWSSRSPFDRNQRLWCAWSVRFGNPGGTTDECRETDAYRSASLSVLRGRHQDQSKRRRIGSGSGSWGPHFFFGGDTAYPDNFPLYQQIRDFLEEQEELLHKKVRNHIQPDKQAVLSGWWSRWKARKNLAHWEQFKRQPRSRPMGLIDLAALPIGAYSPSFYMHDSHMNPSEAFQVHEALGARQSVAIHWGTFELSEEPCQEPAQWLRRVVQRARRRRRQSQQRLRACFSSLWARWSQAQERVASHRRRLRENSLLPTLSCFRKRRPTLVSENFIALPYGGTIVVPEYRP
jgi:L-ascorbate metabolism protein UlaG (beta-lactamase superfamily)